MKFFHTMVDIGYDNGFMNQWFMKVLVQKFEIVLVFVEHLSCLLLVLLLLFPLTLFRMSIFGLFTDGEWGKKDPSLPKLCHRYPTVMKLGTAIPYLKKIQKIYESRDTPTEFC